MRNRWIVVGVGAVMVLAVSVGIAFAAGRGSGSQAVTASTGRIVAAYDTMHDSAAMRSLHDQMPAQARARCEALHQQMGQMMGNMGSMMGGSGTMGSASVTGSEMMGQGSHASHHSGISQAR